MAACSKISVGGYQCELVGDVSEDCVCELCKHVAREPHTTSCCGGTVCEACITPVLEDKKPCPSCEIVEFTTLLNVKYQRRILALEVRCTMKDSGCEWTGKLEGLEAHLDVNTGDCEYVDIECPNKCDLPVQKRNLPTHLANSCPKREFVCQYCNFKATYEVVSNDHWPQCSFYPMPCPNACGIQAFERGDLEAHLLQCPLEVVECDFSHAGCNTKLPRQDLERHMEESTQKHLVLMSAMCARIGREFEQKLDKQRDEFQRYMEQKERETVEKNEHVQHQLEQTAQQTREHQQREEQFEHKLQEKDTAIKAVEDQLKQTDKEVQREAEETKKGMKELSQKTVQELAEKDAKIRKVQERIEEENKEFKQELQAQHQQITALELQNQKLKKERDEQIRAVKQQFEGKQQEIECKLQNKSLEFEREKTAQNHQTEMVEAKIRDLQQQLQQKAQQVEILQRHTAPICSAEFPPPTFEIFNLRKHGQHTPPLYTHPRGYKFRFYLDIVKDSEPPVRKELPQELLYKQDRARSSLKRKEIPFMLQHHIGASYLQTNIQVIILSMNGEFDGELKWPAKFTITLQLIDQQRNRDHITVIKTFQWNRPTEVEYFRQECLAMTEDDHLNRYIVKQRTVLRVVKVERH